MFSPPKDASLARPTLLPDFDRTSGLPAFASVTDALSVLDCDDAIYVLYPERAKVAATRFLTDFPGETLYAVKANPHPALLKIYWTSGVKNFDVASIREIDLVRSVARDAKMYLMHPIKSRRTIRYAYEAGIRDMAFDSADELHKIIAETDGADDLRLHLRISVPSLGAAMPLEGKFGAGRRDAISLLQQARDVSERLGVCFHVGSQCMEPKAFETALGHIADIIAEAGVTVDSLDCGGGFPIAYPGMVPPPLSAFFQRITDALHVHGLQDIPLIGEPGRYLCAEAGSTLVRVELRKGQDLYINDGSYGSLFDAAQCGWKHPVSAPGLKGEGTTQAFRFFGPTCDSLDMMAGPFTLPSNIAEGDWIEIGNLGAYGQALSTRFNGFYSDTTIAVVGCC